MVQRDHELVVISSIDPSSKLSGLLYTSCSLVLVQMVLFVGFLVWVSVLLLFVGLGSVGVLVSDFVSLAYFAELSTCSHVSKSLHLI